MLLTMESLLALAAKAEPRSVEACMVHARALDGEGALHPELRRLSFAFEAEVERHAATMKAFENRSQRDAASPVRSPLSRRRGSLVLDMGSLVDSRSPASPIAKPPSPHPSHPSLNYQSLFLAAALQLLEEKRLPAELALPAVDAHPKLPPGTILAGYLKKAKDNSLRTSSKKYVILTQGVLTYYADVSAVAQPSSASATEVVLVPRRFLCRDNLSQRFQHKHAFELIATAADGPTKRKTKLVWIAASAAERAVWVHAIRCLLDRPVNVARPPDGDCYAFVLLQRALRDARRKDAYVCALRGCKRTLVVPVAWVHAQSPNAALPCGMAQVFKDLGRDKVQINHVVYSGADGTESVVGALVRAVMDVCTELSEADALGVVRSILLASNRTQSGGDTYETVDFLFHNAALVVLCPGAVEAAPLQVNVALRNACPEISTASPTKPDPLTRGISVDLPAKAERASMSSVFSFGDDLDSSLPAKALNLFARETETAELVSFAGERMHINIVAATSYKICDANPTGDVATDTWATVDAVFEQSFVYAPHYGVLEGHGTVRVAVTLAAM
ncbi:hypothetical protein ACHHYP_11648 [Achlya hypogyna]|uniref:PH domain-containing protein n=1 Tax=Achlya hypogyna TaxID=1202772 RepID=A0A1V9YIU6_ACHHY|nr:hypothetical protein ACHHYP_11648 [Achlya hypogyna]